ncbi:MAG: right-handed parallel beta-helix repeat-containing protein [Chitinispirillaceae bacterium]|nr:right-handed parallel beta-helix repeat-containing protein [Chitinispirillaceae bacterium]
MIVKTSAWQTIFVVLVQSLIPAYGSTRIVATSAEVTSAISSAAAGDTILVKAGTYAFSQTINISVSGTEAKRCVLMAYPGDIRPLFNLAGSTGQGSKLNGSHWHIKGIRFQNAANNGMHIKGSGNIVEYCDFFECGNTGCQIEGGASNNLILNCDSYYNTDASQGNADGFAPKMDVGTGNILRGCRSWQNSDDGYDGYLRGADKVITTYENCWCVRNGYLKSGSASSGNGNGFKMGGSDDKNLQHHAVLRNCLSVGNRVKGFDQNNNKGSMTLYNCSAYNNGTNYKIDASTLASGNALIVTNCISAGSGAVSLSGGTITTCSWSSGFSVSTADFVSVDTAGITGPRQSDGSLPAVRFLHLASGSKLIDAGTIISGMPYAGSKPDLGCFETGLPTGINRFQRSAGNRSSAASARLSFFDGRLTAKLTGTGREADCIELFDAAGKKLAGSKAEAAIVASGRYLLRTHQYNRELP